jgi:hypothetical protein
MQTDEGEYVEIIEICAHKQINSKQLGKERAVNHGTLIGDLGRQIMDDALRSNDRRVAQVGLRPTVRRQWTMYSDLFSMINCPFIMAQMFY